MIHGKTKIELYNPNTKIKNIVKSENTFQSAVLAKHLNPYGEFSLPNGGWNYTNLVGGLLLFKNAIQVGERFMPAGNKMVGQGYRGCVTQGTYSLLGTFNQAESAASDAAITQVYDFETNQANGQIGCIALTSYKGGQIGYGIGSNTPYALYSFDDGFGANIGEVGNQGGYYNGFQYYVSGYSNGVLSIRKTPVDVEKGSIFRGLAKTLTFDLEELEITPKSVDAYWNIMGDCGNGVFRFWSEQIGYSSSPVASGGTIYYYEFDATTETLSQKTLTNTSGETLPIANYGVQFRGDKVFIAAYNGQTTGNVYVFKASDSTFLKKFTGVSNFSYYNGTSAPQFLPCELCDDLFLLQGYNSTIGQYTYLWDAVADTTERMNLTYNRNTGNNFGAMSQMRSVDGILKYGARITNSNYSAYVAKNPLYLATINNLQSPVTKTAAQTMKVTYTLTES